MLQITGYCDDFLMNDVKDIASQFMRDVLGFLPGEFSLSDDSTLDDFSLMSRLDTGELTWDEFVLNKVADTYGLTLSSTRINLVTLFTQIEQSTNVTYH